MHYRLSEANDLVLFLPSTVDQAKLVEITKVGDTYRKFVEPETGKIHDCAEYYAQYKKRPRGIWFHG